MTLTKLHLEYFKCFRKLSLPLAPLTLLTGFNSAGKSTIMQALALLYQTAKDDEWSRHLLLNGSTISLGTVNHVIDENYGRNEMVIGIESEEYQYRWRLLSENREDYIIPIHEIALDDPLNSKKISYLIDSKMTLHRLLPRECYDEFPQMATWWSDLISPLTYLSAERIGPREIYPVNRPTSSQTVGVQGEYTPWYLFNNSDKKISEALKIEKESSPFLPRQVAAHLEFFFPGSDFVITPINNANLVTLGIRTHPGGNYHRPQNAGYGLTHILPILTACLGADPGQIVLIENAEAHLHPAAQAQMGLFLAKVTNFGVQIILETHSDHVLNGVRRAVKERQLTPEQVAIYFFKPRQEGVLESNPQVLEVLIDEEGNLDQWPKGFFDQFEKDTAYFAGWGDHGIFGK